MPRSWTCAAPMLCVEICLPREASDQL